jgi:hypothetical protein
MYRDLCFVPNLIQIIIDIVVLGYRPNIDLELCKKCFKEFFQSRMENDGARTPIEAHGDQNYVQIKNHMKWTHLYYKRTCTTKSKLEVNGISSKLSSIAMHEFGDSTFST